MSEAGDATDCVQMSRSVESKPFRPENPLLSAVWRVPAGAIRGAVDVAGNLRRETSPGILSSLRRQDAGPVNLTIMIGIMSL